MFMTMSGEMVDVLGALGDIRGQGEGHDEVDVRKGVGHPGRPLHVTAPGRGRRSPVYGSLVLRGFGTGAVVAVIGFHGDRPLARAVV